VGVGLELFITRVCGCYFLTSSFSHHFSSLCVYNPVCMSEIWFTYNMPLFRFTHLEFLNYFSDFPLDWLFVLICCASWT